MSGVRRILQDHVYDVSDCSGDSAESCLQVVFTPPERLDMILETKVQFFFQDMILEVESDLKDMILEVACHDTVDMILKK